MKLAGARSCVVTSSVCCTALMRMRTRDPLTATGPSLYQRYELPYLHSPLRSAVLTGAYNPAAASSFALSGRIPSTRRLSTNVVRVRLASYQRLQVFTSNVSCTQMQGHQRRIVSIYGIFFLASSAAWMIVIFPFVVLAGLLARVFDPKRQRPAAALIQVRHDTWFHWHLCSNGKGGVCFSGFLQTLF